MSDALNQPSGLTTLSRDEHCVSRKNISKAAVRVLYRLHEGGYRACLVGGAVRDLLLGDTPKDYDIATDATPEQVRQLFRNSRIIGRRFRLVHVFFGREIVEVATFRGSEDDGSGDRRVVDGLLVRDNVYGAIEEDAVRRDFTVNALYYDISNFTVLDFVGGMADLHRRTLDLIGDPEERYREDPVRMLRAARLAAKLRFTVAPRSAAPLAAMGDLLGEAAPARLFDETLKLFLSGHGVASLQQLQEHDLLRHLFPATAEALRGDAGEAVQKLIERTLIDTDARVARNKPVTPAFLFAALLWQPARELAERYIADGMEQSLAWIRAGERVIAAQAERVALPRRFSVVVLEIWMLQSRFGLRVRKRVFRLMRHPRFRAAYDLLVLRSDESAQLAELGEWWTRAQELSQEALAKELDRLAAAGGAGTDDDDAPAAAAPSAGSRRRRRRKPRGAKPPPRDD